MLSPVFRDELLITLFWQGDPPPGGKSDLALALMQELKSHGMVSHSAWQDMGPDDHGD